MATRGEEIRGLIGKLGRYANSSFADASGETKDSAVRRLKFVVESFEEDNVTPTDSDDKADEGPTSDDVVSALDDLHGKFEGVSYDCGTSDQRQKCLDLIGQLEEALYAADD